MDDRIYLGVIDRNGMVLRDSDLQDLYDLFPDLNFSFDRFFQRYKRVPVNCKTFYIPLHVLERRLFASIGIFDPRVIKHLRQIKK